MGALTQLDTKYWQLSLSRRADHHLSSIVLCTRAVGNFREAKSAVLKAFKTEEGVN